MNETMLITVYCFVDEFIKAIMNYPLGNTVLGHWERKRGPKKRLGIAGVTTLSILRFYPHVHDMKPFHRLIQNAYGQYFPACPIMRAF
jgi:hypothetical protein